MLSDCPGWRGTFTGSWQHGSGQSPGECPLPCQLRSGWQASWNEAPFFPSQVSLFGSRLAGLAPGTRGMNVLSRSHVPGSWGTCPVPSLEVGATGEARAGRMAESSGRKPRVLGRQNQKDFQAVVPMVILRLGK